MLPPNKCDSDIQKRKDFYCYYENIVRLSSNKLCMLEKKTCPKEFQSRLIVNEAFLSIMIIKNKKKSNT